MLMTTNPAQFNWQQASLYLENIRRSLILIGTTVILTSIGMVPMTLSALRYLKALVHADLVAFGIPEVFLALVQLDLEIAVLICMPLIFCKILAPLSQFFPSFSNKAIFVFWISSVVLFYVGILFCLKVTLPYGVQFLLGFQGPTVTPLISVDKFISFCALFLFGFGVVFQIPVVMVLIGRLFSIDAKRIARQRRKAVLVITVISAILTPTPDAVNMMLMAVPLYLLFEIGLLGMRFLK